MRSGKPDNFSAPSQTRNTCMPEKHLNSSQKMCTRDPVTLANEPSQAVMASRTPGAFFLPSLASSRLFFPWEFLSVPSLSSSWCSCLLSWFCSLWLMVLLCMMRSSLGIDQVYSGVTRMSIYAQYAHHQLMAHSCHFIIIQRGKWTCAHWLRFGSVLLIVNVRAAASVIIFRLTAGGYFPILA